MATPSIPAPVTAGIPIEAMATTGAAAAIKPITEVTSALPKIEAGTSAPAEATKLLGTTVDAPKTADLEKLNALKDIKEALDESARILLKMRKPELWVIAQAASCRTPEGQITPMGLEYQYDALDMMRHMPIKDQALQEQLNKLKFPEKSPTEAFSEFITDEKIKDKFPPGYEPGRLVAMLNTPGVKIRDVVNKFEDNPNFSALREGFFQKLSGEEINSRDMFAAVGIDFAKNEAAIREAMNGKRKTGIDKMLILSLLFAVMQEGQQEVQQDSKQGQPGRGG